MGEMAKTKLIAAGEAAERIVSLFDPLTPTAAVVALAIYRILARKDATKASEIAQESGVDVRSVEELLSTWPAIFRNEAGEVIGFWGLTGLEMAHTFVVEGMRRYTWCAWDALFIPHLIGQSASVLSTTPIRQRPVRLTVTPDNISVTPEIEGPLFVSFRLPPEDQWEQDILKTFCHHVFFLFEEEIAQWMAENPDTTALPLHEAFALGRRKNERQFGKALL